MKPGKKEAAWEISVCYEREIIAKFEIPAHKLSTRDLESFLIALVARYGTDGPEEMAAFYLNHRNGAPHRSSLAEVRSFQNTESAPFHVGYFCGLHPELMVTATRAITTEMAEAVKRI